MPKLWRWWATELMQSTLTFLRWLLTSKYDLQLLPLRHALWPRRLGPGRGSQAILHVQTPYLSSDSGTGCDGLMVVSFCAEKQCCYTTLWYMYLYSELWQFPDSTVIYFISLSCHLLAETESCVNLCILFTLILTTITIAVLGTFQKMRWWWSVLKLLFS